MRRVKEETETRNEGIGSSVADAPAKLTDRHMRHSTLLAPKMDGGPVVNLPSIIRVYTRLLLSSLVTAAVGLVGQFCLFKRHQSHGLHTGKQKTSLSDRKSVV